MSDFDDDESIVRFQPPWWLKSGHVQTLIGAYWSVKLPEHRAIPRRIELDDGDTVIIHDDCPEGWQVGGRVALLAHGLGGCHRSPLLVRIADKLVARGVRVFRWDMRGCGAGHGLAVHPYHAGCSEDLRHVVNTVIELCSAKGDPAESTTKVEKTPACRLTLFGASLSGNILLKYLGEAPEAVPAEVVHAVAVNPPIDLAASVKALDRRDNMMYDRHFAKSLLQHLGRRQKILPMAPMPAEAKVPRTMQEFDEWYTAPMTGYPDAATYYAECSAAQFIPSVQTPTTIITASNDPLVPVELFSPDRIRYPKSVRLKITKGGGHLGYINRRNVDPDVHWLDWRVVEIVRAA